MALLVGLLAPVALAQAPGPKEGPQTAQVEDLAPAIQVVGSSEQFISYVPSVPPVKISKFDDCSCVSYVRSKRPDIGPMGTPKAYSKNHKGSLIPWVGAVGISKEGDVWHAWYVESLEGDGRVSEAHFGPCGKTTRTLKQASRLLVGYF